MINLSLRKEFLLSLNYPRTSQNFILDKLLYRQKVTPYPRLVNCFITEACNFNCPMCHVREPHLKKESQLSFESLRRVFDEASVYSPSFQITGGEPLLHPQLREIISYLTKKRMIKGLVTNGLLLEEKAEIIVGSGLDFLAVSLDGPDEKTQFSRGFVKDSFYKAVKGIKKVILLRGNKPFPNIRLATVISKSNLNNFDKLFDLSLTLGVDQWSLSHFFFYNNKILAEQEKFSVKWQMGDNVWGENIGHRQAYLDSKERQTLDRKLKELRKRMESEKMNLKVSLPSCSAIDEYYSGIFPGRSSFCNSPYNQVFIRGDGGVEICQGYLLGNIRNQGLYSLWHGSKASHFRKVFAEKGLTPACFRCCALNIKFAK